MEAIRLDHPVDPLVDCVFKALLGDPANIDLLEDFLNALLRPASPIVEVEILNPYNDKEMEADKLTVVDVKARDAGGRTFQVEVQLGLDPELRHRMVYTWSDVYQGLLSAGQGYHQLTPVISIWLLKHVLLRDSELAHHCFVLSDPQDGCRLSDHLAIHVWELSRWRGQAGDEEAERWLHFLKEGHRWTELPQALNTPTMRKAMATLQRFSDKGQDYWRYQARQNYLREQESFQFRMREAEEGRLAAEEGRLAAEEGRLAAEEGRLAAEEGRLAAEEGRLAAEERSRADRAQAEQDRARAERYRELLRQAGLDPEGQQVGAVP